jgi:hypothetical protein
VSPAWSPEPRGGDPTGPGFLDHAITLGPDFGVMSWIIALR